MHSARAEVWLNYSIITTKLLLQHAFIGSCVPIKYNMYIIYLHFVYLHLQAICEYKERDLKTNTMMMNYIICVWAIQLLYAYKKIWFFVEIIEITQLYH